MAASSPEGARYYADPSVQRRIREYCSNTTGQLTCAFVSSLPPDGFITWERAPRSAAEDLPALFEAGWDISRALLDREALVVYFEIDVTDPDAPQEALLRPAQAFFDLEPVYRAVRAELTRLGMPLLDIMTGRGYHFAGRVPLSDAVVRRITALAPADSAMRERTHIGLGMVLEHLAHNIYRGAAAHGVPVVFDGVEVGRGGAAREAVSLDLSGYGDPVGVRQLRAAFSTYQSHRIRPDLFGLRAARDVPVLAAVPRRGRSLFWMLEHARTATQAAALAPSEDARIPDVTDGLTHLVEEYDASRLAAFHRAFYADARRCPVPWTDTDERWRFVDRLPCLRRALSNPNDALLKPTVLQHLTRYLVSQGWSARHVAGLVWSKYMRDAGWGDRWSRLNPRRRAEFDIRVFAGALATGIDTAGDFNCVSSQEKGLCPRGGCTHDLREDRARLLERVTL